MAYFGRRRYYSSRYSAKKKYSGRRRYYRRYRFQYRNRKSPYVRPHMVKRLGNPTVDGSISNRFTQVLNNGETQYLKFMLNSINGPQDFFYTYNEYKIRAVKVSFIPLANISNLAQSSYASLLYSALDINGGGENITRDDIRQYQTVKWTPYTRIHSRYFYPRNPIHDSNTSTGSNLILPGKQPWISTESRSVLHYGLYISPPEVPGLDPTEPIYQIECTYYLSFRGTK